ncbi:MAG TPA: nucleotidyltransferase domain-containing protein, partial [Actinomycetes bacterium]
MVTRPPLRREEVVRLLAAHRDELAAMGVESLALFGSVARDEAGPNSDIDLLVKLDPTASVGLFKFVEIQ